jgi:hypothetical protein
MAARCRYRIDHFGTQFIGKLAQIAMGKPFHVGRHIDRIEQRR